ncbi:hypothetical protein JHK87_006980 [Glycine soja]|nr:hypothetical protein JHK87_006980 [Glycine soja]
MATPPPSPPQSENPPEVTSKRTRQSTRLRSLTSRCLDGPRPVVNVNPATGRGSGPHKEKFHSYLGVVAREKVPIVHANVVVGLDKPPPKSVGEPNRLTSVATDDPLVELVKKSYVVYTKPMELAWDGAKFGLPNASNGFFITHVDVTEIILGDKCLNISVLQLWMMFMNDWSTSIGFSPVYGFLEPQSIRCTKDTREECQKYIETWVKESHREIYLGPYFNQ